MGARHVDGLGDVFARERVRLILRVRRTPTKCAYLLHADGDDFIRSYAKFATNLQVGFASHPQSLPKTFRCDFGETAKYPKSLPIARNHQAQTHLLQRALIKHNHDNMTHKRQAIILHKSQINTSNRAYKPRIVQKSAATSRLSQDGDKANNFIYLSPQFGGKMYKRLLSLPKCLLSYGGGHFLCVFCAAVCV